MYHSFVIHSSMDSPRCQWTSRLLPRPGYYKQCCSEHWGTCVSFSSGFLGVYTQEWDCWCIWQFYFQFFKDSPHCSHGGCTSLHSHQQCKRVPFSPHPLQHLLPIDFWIVAILTGVKWYLIVVLICISLIMNGVDHIFMCLLAICLSFWRNVCFVLWPIFWLDCLFFWNWAAGVAFMSLRLILCQLLHLLLFSPILKAVFSPCI